MISKVKSEYWAWTLKFGIKIPQNIIQAQNFDTENSNTLWWDSILKEIRNILIAFEVFDGEID